MSLLEEDELMSLVYSQMLASLEDKRGTSLGWEKLVVEKKAAEKARLIRQSEAEARTKTVAVARARAEVAGAGMLRAAARVRAATEESAVRAEASRAQEARLLHSSHASGLASAALLLPPALIGAVLLASLALNLLLCTRLWRRRQRPPRATDSAERRVKSD